MMGFDVFFFFYPFSGSLKKTTLTDPGDIDVYAWHFSYHWQRWERERPVGCIYKTPLMSGVAGWKAKRRYSACGEMKLSWVQPCSGGTLIHRPFKQAWSTHTVVDCSSEAVSGEEDIIPFQVQSNHYKSKWTWKHTKGQNEGRQHLCTKAIWSLYRPAFVDIVRENLHQQDEDDLTFMSKIITSTKGCVYCYNLQTKQQSDWKHKSDCNIRVVAP